VLHAAASKIDGFLWSETCVSSTQLNRPIAANRTYLHFEKYELQEVVFSKTNFVLTWRQCDRCLRSTTDISLYRDTCVSSTQLNKPSCSKESICTPRNT
jgi:hypothetical protein